MDMDYVEPYALMHMHSSETKLSSSNWAEIKGPREEGESMKGFRSLGSKGFEGLGFKGLGIRV